MYKQEYGIIETLAPLHVGATAGEESGNLNLIFRDQFTQTGIIPGSSIRGRLRADMRLAGDIKSQAEKDAAKAKALKQQAEADANYWYGHEAELGKPESTTESRIKLEHASIVWLPVFCPGQPIVWVSCPRLLMRYQRIAGLKNLTDLKPYTASSSLKLRESKEPKTKGKKFLFFNLGFLSIEHQQDFPPEWFPSGNSIPAVVVDDNDMGMIHDMALYRQSRVALEKTEKKAVKGAFFNTEALPEGTILVFPAAIKPNEKEWKPLNGEKTGDIYLGGLESIGFGHCHLTIKEV